MIRVEVYFSADNFIWKPEIETTWGTVTTFGWLFFRVDLWRN